MTFPVDTLSPLSPYEQLNVEERVGASNRRRRLQWGQRPFSELYTEDDPDPLGTENQHSPYTSHRSTTDSPVQTPLVDHSSSHDEQTTQSTSTPSVENTDNSEQIAPTSQGDEDIEREDEGEDPTEGLELTNDVIHTVASDTLESQPMEMSDELEELAEDTDADMQTSSDGEESEGLSSTSTSSASSSIELTVDSPLRILEESEIIRELEETVLSHANLLDDNGEDSDGSEYMDTSEVHRPEHSPSESHSQTTEEENSLNNRSIDLESSHEPQARAESATEQQQPFLSSDSTRNTRTEARARQLDGEEDSVHLSLQEGTVATINQYESMCVQGLPDPSTLPGAQETLGVENQSEQEQSSRLVINSEAMDTLNSSSSGAGVMLAASTTLSNNSSEEEGLPLPEAVEQDANAMKQDQDNSTLECNKTHANTQRNVLSTENSTSEQVSDSNRQIEISFPNFPLEASEPICLDMVSVGTCSTTQMLVQTPSASTHREHFPKAVTLEGAEWSTNMSRSNSGPRRSLSGMDKVRARTRTEEPKACRPQLEKRSVSSPQDFRPTKQQEGLAVPHTAAESTPGSSSNPVVMAVAISPFQSPTTCRVSSPVLIADGRMEPGASVTPLPSPEATSVTCSFTAGGTASAVATPINSSSCGIDGERDAGLHGALSQSFEEQRLRMMLDSSAVTRQTSSAPSTLLSTSRVSDSVLPVSSSSQSQQRSERSTSVIYATPVSPGGTSFRQTCSLPGHHGDLNAGETSHSSAANVSVTLEVPGSGRGAKAVSRSKVSGNDVQIMDSNIGPTSGLPLPSNVTTTDGLPETSNGSTVGSMSGLARACDLSENQARLKTAPSRETIQTMLKTYVRASQVQKPLRPPKDPTKVGAPWETLSASQGTGAQRPEGLQNVPPRPRRMSRKRQAEARGQAVQLQIQDQGQRDRPPPPPPPRQGHERRTQPTIEGDRESLPASKLCTLFS